MKKQKDNRKQLTIYTEGKEYSSWLRYLSTMKTEESY